MVQTEHVRRPMHTEAKHAWQHAAAPRADAPDRELIERCRADDAGAWDAVVCRYQRLVFTVALRNGLSGADAADVTQSTFLALLESLGTIGDADRLASWLMTVARRKAWRLRERAGHEALVTEDDPRLEGTGCLDDELADWERTVVIEQGLRRLGNPCGELLHALYLDVEQPTYAVVAARIGRSIGSIGPMRARCLERLRRLLGEDAR